MSKRVVLLAVLALCLSMLIASSSFAAIGIYNWKATTTVPATVSYVLNTDATQVKIEIVPAAGGPAVKTEILTGETYCKRGKHSWVWTGLTDGGTDAPFPADYKAVITATAEARTGNDFTPLWELDPTEPDLTGIGNGWKWATVNTDPTSQWYGYVYAAASPSDTTKHNVYMWEPDGTYFGKFQTTCEFLAWSDQSSAPFTVEVGPEGNLYVGSFSRNRITVISPDGVTRLHEVKIDGSSNYTGGTRALGVTGTDENFKIVSTYFGQASVPTASCTLYTSSGQEYPPSPMNPYAVGGWPLYQPVFDSKGDIIMPAWVNVGGNSGGALTKYSMSGTLLAQNNNIRRGTGVAWSPDGQYLYVSRFCNQGTAYPDADNTAIYRIPASALFTTANPDTDTDVEKFGFTTTGTGQRAFNIKCDGVGNLVASAGHTDIGGGGGRVGVYAPPDSGSTDTRTTSNFHWSGDHSPSFDGSNSPVTVSVCGGTGTVTVYVSDLEGYADIAACYLDLSQFGGAQQTPMNRNSFSGNNATYQLPISVPGSTPTGDYNCKVYVKDVHEEVPVTEGNVVVRVTGVLVSGKVSVATAGWGVAGATVTATDGVHNYSATTDADGNYTLNLAPGTYTIDATKGTGYGNPDPPTSITVVCGSTQTVNRSLTAVNIRTCTGVNYQSFTGRSAGEPVCVEGVVLRAPYIEGVQQGFDGFYYIWDRSYASMQQGVRIVNWTGQEQLKEGDKVIVEGIWSIASGINQGYVNPIRAPFKVSSGNALATPTTFYHLNSSGQLMTNSQYGTFFKASGPVAGHDSERTDHFTVNTWTSAEDPKPSPVDVYIVSPTSTGATRPPIGTLVEVNGFMSMPVPWGPYAISVGKASDIKVIPIVDALNKAKALENGSSVIIDLPAEAPPFIVTSAATINGTDNKVPWIYVEDANRTTGIKVVGSMPEGQKVWPGDTVRRLAGIVRQTSDDYELALADVPTITPGMIENLPKPIAFSNLALGGGWFGSVPAVSDRGEGLNNQGLLATIYGRVTDITYEVDPVFGQLPSVVFIDDGSGVRGGIAGPPVVEKTGVKCYVGRATITDPGGSSVDFLAAQPATLSVGDYVVVNGIVGSEWVGPPVNRIRVLRMRFCVDPIAPFEIQFLDQFRIVEDVP